MGNKWSNVVPKLYTPPRLTGGRPTGGEGGLVCVLAFVGVCACAAVWLLVGAEVFVGVLE